MDNSGHTAGARAALTDAGTKALYDYWNALRNGRGAPLRREVDPTVLRGLLSSIFMLEMIDTQHAIFRIAGTALCAAFGREFRDHNFIEIWDKDSRTDVLHLLQRVTTRCEVGLIAAQAATLDRTVIPGEFLVLPLSDTNGQRTRVIGIAGCGERLQRLGWRKIVRLNARTIVSFDPASTVMPFVADTDASQRLTILRPPLQVVKTTSASVPPGLTQIKPARPNPWREHIRTLLQLDE